MKAKRRLSIKHYFSETKDVQGDDFPSSAWSLLKKEGIQVDEETYAYDEHQDEPKRRACEGCNELTHKESDPAGSEPVDVPGNPTIEVIAHEVASGTWPGRAGGRNARVMVALLKRNDLTTKRSLRKLADDCGLADKNSIGKALRALEARGWITHVPGRTNKDGSGEWEPVKGGKGTSITLTEQSGVDRYPVSGLPNPARDEFANGAAGDSGFLFAMRAIFEGKTEGLTRPAIEELTGLSPAAVKELMKKAKRVELIRKDTDGGWTFNDPESLLQPGNDSKVKARQAKRSGTKKGTKTKTAKIVTEETSALGCMASALELVVVPVTGSP